MAVYSEMRFRSADYPKRSVMVRRDLYSLVGKPGQNLLSQVVVLGG